LPRSVFERYLQFPVRLPGVVLYYTYRKVMGFVHLRKPWRENDRLWGLSGHSSELQIQRSRVRVPFPALPYFLSSGFGTASTQLHENNWGVTRMEKWGRGDPQKLAPTSPTSGGRSVSMVRLRTKVTEFFFFTWKLNWTLVCQLLKYYHTFYVLRFVHPYHRRYDR
jgi:hypothetical protein